MQRWPIVGRRSELEIFEQALGSGERAGLAIHLGLRPLFSVGDSLLAVRAAVLGDDFDEPARRAWALARKLTVETMLGGASAPRPVGS